MDRINVTKSFLPPLNEFTEYLEQIWASDQLTNQGPLVKRFENEIKNYLNVDDFHLLTNGTLALMISLKALDIDDGEIITTPFSYVGTSSAILWQGLKPVFVDIEPETFCIDPDKIEAAITPNTKAILAVHVFGYPCDVEKINKIAKKHKIKVIYDGAHAFGVKLKGRSILAYGDISMLSFHATKVFHTIEGGGLIAKNKSVGDKIELLIRFGHDGDTHYVAGINAKASEFQAAMGLSNLKYVKNNIKKREAKFKLYDRLLSKKFKRRSLSKYVEYNYSYYPVMFDNELELINKIDQLNKLAIYPRRYFYPSLNTIPYMNSTEKCPISEDIASRIICVPMSPDLSDKDIKRICEVLNK